MNHKKLPFYISLFTICLLAFGNQILSAQSSDKTSTETYENIYIHWFFALDKTRLNNGISKPDFDLFIRFSQKSIDSVRGDFMTRIGNDEITTSNVGKYEAVLQKSIFSLYLKFENIKQRYPSSVEEFRKTKAPYLSVGCDSACSNIDFETGNLSSWYAYYANNNSSTTGNNLNYITGGLAGAVIHAANDTLTSNPLFYNPTVGPNPKPDYQVNITSGNRGDQIVPSVPVVSPFGGHYSVMLGDSTHVNYGAAILTQTFLVGASNANFTYQYAVFLENPVNHSYYQQPFFKVAVLDQNSDTIPFCGEYYVVAKGGIPGFNSVYYAPSADSVYYKDWTIVNVPLKHYIGQCVTVVFEAVDCALGGHFSYAYIDASCSPLNIISSSAVFCGQDSIELTAPAGESNYFWTGPAGGITSSDTSRSISVIDTGIYTVVVTPFTGATCNDTLTIHIGKTAGPMPQPSFKADTVCVGGITTFTNTSNPISGASFYWDFYNLGNYEDSTTNPTWKYNIPGIYTVKLHEVLNGCGIDTYLKVVVDSIVTTSFIADTVCARDTVYFTNTSTGASAYKWNFGDPASGPSNASTLVNPYHVYNSSGTYSVTLFGNNFGNCPDSTKKKIVVVPNVKPTITGTDSVCNGSVAVLTAGGGTSYLWSNNATTSTIKVYPTTTTTYTVKVSNGRCYLDTTYTVVIKPIGTGAISGKGSVCFGDTVVLNAYGGGTYVWNTGATTSSITVLANSFKDTAYSVIISNGDSCTSIKKRINIDSISGFACCNDTIFSGNSTTLNGNGSTTYFWTPPIGLSCDTCPNPIANPTVTTTYTLITTTDAGCTASSLVTITVEIPCADFFVPNVFTPNDNGINDTYLIKVKFMSAYQIDIFNRWGKKVFSSNNPDNPWDGNIDGSPASAGVYYYILRSTCENGNSFEKHGFLHLIRN